MTTSMVRDLLRQRPFRPFRVVMSSGEAYEVRHPEMAWVTKNDLFIGIDVADDGPLEHRRPGRVAVRNPFRKALERDRVDSAASSPRSPS